MPSTKPCAASNDARLLLTACGNHSDGPFEWRFSLIIKRSLSAVVVLQITLPRQQSGGTHFHKLSALNFQSGAYRLSRRSEEHTSELQSRFDLVCRLLLEKKKKKERTT